MKNSTLLLIGGAALAYFVARRAAGGWDVGSAGSDVAVSSPGVAALTGAAQAPLSVAPTILSSTAGTPARSASPTPYRASGSGSSLGIVLAQPGQKLSTIAGTVLVPSASTSPTPQARATASLSTALGTIFTQQPKPKVAAAIMQRAAPGLGTSIKTVFTR